MIRAFFKKHQIHPTKVVAGPDFLFPIHRLYPAGPLEPGKALITGSGASSGGRLGAARAAFPIGKKILAISPHSDDEAIGAGGIIWAHRELRKFTLSPDRRRSLRVCARGRPRKQLNKAQLIAARKQEVLRTQRP